MSEFTAQQLADFYQKVADGDEIETTLLGSNAGWVKAQCGPDLGSNHAEYRIKPKNKVIDMSVLIKSGIDCEFDNRSNNRNIDKLKEITPAGRVNRVGTPYYINDKGVYWERCAPRSNHVHAWQGGECPVPEGFEVKMWLRSGKQVNHVIRDRETFHHNAYSPEGVYWGLNHGPASIVAFEVVGVADGYVFPWDSEKEQDNECSLPHRQLRNVFATPSSVSIGSLPHRQLRNMLSSVAPNR